MLKFGCSRVTACSLTNAERKSHSLSHVLTTCILFHTDKDILEPLYTHPFAHPCLHSPLFILETLRCKEAMAQRRPVAQEKPLLDVDETKQTPSDVTPAVAP